MATYRSIITNAGASLLSYQLAHGGSVNIYRAAAGNGIPSGDPRQLTTLVSEQPSLNIDLGAKQFIDGNPSVVIIPVQINNAGITVPTAIREIGLFAEDPNGEEILFAYSYIDGADTDNILPPPQVTNPEQQFDTVHTHDIILFITSDENAVISVTYTPSNFVSQLQLVEVTDGLQSNINSHASSKKTHGISGSYYIAKTSRSDQLPAWDDIQGKPSSFTPSAHASTHKTGGGDVIAPSDIGAASSTDLAIHRNSKQTHGASGSYYLAKTSRSDQLPAWSDVQDKPSSYTPSAHANSHKSGGSDAITPADIGAASSTDLAIHGNSKQTHGASGSYYLAKTSRSDQLPAWSDIQGKPSSYTPSAHANSHKSGGSDAITPADIGAAVNVVYTATIQAANWSGSSAPFSQSVSVSGILSTDTPIIDVVMSGTYGTDIERSSQWNYVYRAVTGANSITFYAKTKPTIDLPIQIKVVR